jgi:hypothetical protein
MALLVVAFVGLIVGDGLFFYWLLWWLNRRGVPS